jgi:uncharacterized glyoxalase superfamily protein PhnB
MPNELKLVNICPVFISDDVKMTVNYYSNVLGFKYANHIDKIDSFATIYRDSIELIIVRRQKGKIESNTNRYGNGFDAYINTNTLAGVDLLYEEYLNSGAEIIRKPRRTDYGSYEFVIKDIDSRLLGIGLIEDNDLYFRDSNYISN